MRWLVVWLVLGGCKLDNRDPSTRDGGASTLDATQPTLVTIHELRSGTTVTGLVKVRAVATVIADNLAVLADPIDRANGATTQLAIRATNLTLPDVERAGLFADGVVEGDLIEVTAFANANQLDIITATATGERAVVAVPTLSYELLRDPAAIAPYDAMLVRMLAVPIQRGIGVYEYAVYGGGNVYVITGRALDRGSCSQALVGTVEVGQVGMLRARHGADSDVTAGLPCPAFGPEYDRASCSDNYDNDWDDLIDCDSYRCGGICALDDPAIPTTTITAIQQAVARPSGIVKLRDVVVTAVTAQRKVFISDPVSPTAMFGGIEARYGTDHPDLAGLTPGTRVDVVGTVHEEVSSSSGHTVTARVLSATIEPRSTGAPLEPGVTAASQIYEDGGDDAWEGQLVRLANHRLTSGFDPAGFGTLSDGSETVIISKKLTPLSIVPGTCFQHVDGIVLGICGDRPANLRCFVVAPRSAADLVEGSSCP